jgi:hypothetical protein
MINQGLTPTELLDKIRGGLSTKNISKEDLPSLVVLFEQDLIIIDQIKDYHCILIEKEQTKK